MIQRSDSMIPTEKGTYPVGIVVSPRPEQSARDPKHRHSLGQFISSRLWRSYFPTFGQKVVSCGQVFSSQKIPHNKTLSCRRTMWPAELLVISFSKVFYTLKSLVPFSFPIDVTNLWKIRPFSGRAWRPQTVWSQTAFKVIYLGVTLTHKTLRYTFSQSWVKAGKKSEIIQKIIGRIG